jgi:hypothetical protein
MPWPDFAFWFCCPAMTYLVSRYLLALTKRSP